MPINPQDIIKQAAAGEARTDKRLAEYLRVNHAGERLPRPFTKVSWLCWATTLTLLKSSI